MEISTNYRCAINIVKYAKMFVEKHIHQYEQYNAYSRERGAAGCLTFKNDKKDVSDKLQDNEIYEKSMIVKSGEMEYKPTYKQVWYMRTVANIIRRNHSATKFFLLHRKNETSFPQISLKSFYERLRGVMIDKGWMTEDEFKKKVEVMTMHKAKGLEADVVIILEADQGVIPMFNSNSLLFSIFGETPETLLLDEKKLFYVAITRAKKKLYVLHDYMPSGQNGFLEQMDDCY